MKAILEFDFNDAEDRFRHSLMMSASKMYCALNDMKNHLRNKRKYSEEQTFDISEIEDAFVDICEKNDVVELL